jgi:hypothetical protein
MEPCFWRRDWDTGSLRDTQGPGPPDKGLDPRLTTVLSEEIKTKLRGLSTPANYSDERQPLVGEVSSNPCG